MLDSGKKRCVHHQFYVHLDIEPVMIQHAVAFTVMGHVTRGNSDIIHEWLRYDYICLSQYNNIVVGLSMFQYHSPPNISHPEKRSPFWSRKKTYLLEDQTYLTRLTHRFVALQLPLCSSKFPCIHWLVVSMFETTNQIQYSWEIPHSRVGRPSTFAPAANIQPSLEMILVLQKRFECVKKSSKYIYIYTVCIYIYIYIMIIYIYCI